MIDSVWCSNDDILKRKAQKFYKNLFQLDEPSDPGSLTLSTIPRIGQPLFEALIKTVSLDEV